MSRSKSLRSGKQEGNRVVDDEASLNPKHETEMLNSKLEILNSKQFQNSNTKS